MKKYVQERVKARAITKARMDREAAKVKKQALEQQERAERSAMQVHDKLCYQALPSAPAGITFIITAFVEINVA